MLTKPEHFNMLYQEQLLLFIQLRKTVLIPVVLTAVVAWSFWDDLPRDMLLVWMLSIVLVLLLRVALVPQTINHLPDTWIRQRVQKIWWVTILYCALWGLGSAWFMSMLPFEKQMVVIALIVGITAVVLNYTMEKKNALCVYVLNVPLLSYLLVQQSPIYLEIAVMLVLYLLFMLIVMHGQHRQLARAILVRFENQSLLNQLHMKIQDKEVIEQQLLNKTIEAESANQAKSDFLAVVSHEMRTPIHGLIGMLDLLHGVRMNKEAREDLKSARRAARSLRDLVNDILDLSKVEAGFLQLKNKDFAVEECIHDAVVPCMLMAEQQATQVSVEFEQVPSVMHADQGKLKQVLLNLVSNAVKFTAQGRVLIKVSCDSPALSDKHAQNIHFSVQDTGIGIGQEDLQRVFEPFVQLDGFMERNFDGTGLGAGIAKSLVEEMGGELRVSSQLNQGSTFGFTLHCMMQGELIQRTVVMIDAQPAFTLDEVVENEAAIQKADITSSSEKVYRVLVAEDDAISRRIALKRLKRVGFDVTLAEDGKVAWDLLQEQVFDLVLLDLRMPYLDGMTVARNVRQQENKNKETIIIGLSAHASDEVRQQCLAVGMDDFLMKPLEPQEIVAKVDAMLARV
ncbi:MAG: ATP-binding protein [Mariprofundaceae bacterium]|nr:ATP-binding protein [Mariprofundaceae bacterium]